MPPSMTSPSAGPTRTITVKSTDELGPGDVETGVVPLAKSFHLLKVMTSSSARVRLYATAAHRDADVDRGRDTDPTGDHGLVLELVTLGDDLVRTLSPQVDGSNAEDSPTADIPCSITNLGDDPAVIEATLMWVPSEA